MSRFDNNCLWITCDLNDWAAVFSGICLFCGDGKTGHLRSLDVSVGHVSDVALDFNFVQECIHGGFD